MAGTEGRTRVTEAGTGDDIRTIVESIGGENRAEQVIRPRTLPPNLPEPEVLFRRKILTMNFDNSIESDASNMWLDSQSTAPGAFTTDTLFPYGYEQYGGDERGVIPGFSVASLTVLKLTSLSISTEVGKKRNIVIPPSGKIELVVRWMNNAGASGPGKPIFVLHVDNGSQRIAKFRYDQTNLRWDYWNSAGAWTIVTGGSQDLSFDALAAGPPGTTIAWHEIHLAVDFVANKYLWLVSDNLIVDVNTQAAIQTTGTGNRVKAWFELNIQDIGSVKDIFYDKIDLYELVTV